METQVPEYTTFPLQFGKYKWFKPLIVGALTAAFAFAFQFLLMSITGILLEGDQQAIADSQSSSNPLFFQGPGMFMGLGGVAAMLPALALAVLIVRDRPFSSYSSSRGGFNWGAYFKYLVVAFIISGVVTAIVQAVSPDAADGVNKFTVLGFMLFAVLVFFQGAAEEYIYRGLLMQAIGSWTKMPAMAIVVSSMVFAVSHSYNVLGVIAIFLDGLAFAFIVWYTKGLEVSCAAHGIHNFVIVLLAGIGLGSIGGGDILALAQVILTNALLIAAVVVIEKKYHWCRPKGA